jgi:predicted DNA-binding protein (MmcQ/YjbR family)
MSPEDVADLALGFAEVTEEHPFGPGVDVYKVAGKIFVIISLDHTPMSLAVKCEPDLAVELREEYDAVIPGYHLNKRHWNTVILDGSIPLDEIKEMIAHSYEQVVAAFPKLMRARLLPSAGHG